MCEVRPEDGISLPLWIPEDGIYLSLWMPATTNSGRLGVGAPPTVVHNRATLLAVVWHD